MLLIPNNGEILHNETEIKTHKFSLQEEVKLKQMFLN